MGKNERGNVKLEDDRASKPSSEERQRFELLERTVTSFPGPNTTI
jgi:hypothetical protein